MTKRHCYFLVPRDLQNEKYDVNSKNTLAKTGVLFKVCLASIYFVYGEVNLSVCCCFGARPLIFGIKMLILPSSIQMHIDSIDMLISDLTRGQKVNDFDLRLKSS